MNQGETIEGEINQLLSQLNIFDKTNSEVYLKLGFKYLEAKKSREAFDAFQNSIKLKPSYEGYVNMANLLMSTQQYQEAHDIYHKALSLNSASSAVLERLAFIYHKANHLDLAIEYWGKSLSFEKSQKELNFNIALCLIQQNKSFKSLEYFKKEYDLGNNSSTFLLKYGHTLHMLGFADVGAKIYYEGVKANPTKQGFSDLLHILHHAPSYKNNDFKEATLLAYDSCIKPLTHQHDKKFDFTKRKEILEKKKIKVGFFSYRFRFAAADYWAVNILKEFDREKFEIFLYHDSDFEDEGTHEFKEVADHWKEVSELSFDEIAKVVNNDEIDILVDMIGYMGGGRLELFALKSAPVQACWLNYYGTLGMKEIDYIFADNNIVNEEIESNFIEKAYKMPDFFNPFHPKGTKYNLEIAPELPAKANGYITFGSFNRQSKLNENVIDLWAKILYKVDDSKLLISNAAIEELEMKNHLIVEFGKRGIAANRIEFKAYPKDTEEFFKLFYSIDFHLETFPFVGGATTVDALYMGVPVVTFPGDTWVHRSGYSFFKAMQLDELVVENKVEYVEKVCSLVADINELQSIHLSLRDKLMSAVVCDHKRYAKDFQKAFEEMWENYVRG